MIVDLPHTVTSSLYSTFFLPLSHPLFFIKSATPQQATGNHQVDSEGWQRLDMTGPDGESNFTFEALGSLGNLGMTELFFETVEPENAEVPIDDMLEKLPEGGYLIMGPTIENGESEGDAIGAPELDHSIPEGPELLTPAE